MDELPVIKRATVFDSLSDRDKRLIQDSEAELKRLQSEHKLHTRYENTKGELLEGTREELIGRALRGSTNFLDLGAGYGGGLKEAEIISKEIKAYGLGLFKGTEGSKSGWIQGEFEKILVPDYFDVIQSRHGLQHSFNFAISLENALNSLKNGGILILHWDDFYGKPRSKTSLSDTGHKTMQLKNIVSLLKKSGFVIEESKNSQVIKFKRAQEKAQLQKFYSDPILNKFPLNARQAQKSPPLNFIARLLRGRSLWH